MADAPRVPQSRFMESCPAPVGGRPTSAPPVPMLSLHQTSRADAAGTYSYPDSARSLTLPVRSVGEAVREGMPSADGQYAFEDALSLASGSTGLLPSEGFSLTGPTPADDLVHARWMTDTRGASALDSSRGQRRSGISVASAGIQMTTAGGSHAASHMPSHMPAHAPSYMALRYTADPAPSFGTFGSDTIPSISAFAGLEADVNLMAPVRQPISDAGSFSTQHASATASPLLGESVTPPSASIRSSATTPISGYSSVGPIAQGSSFYGLHTPEAVHTSGVPVSLPTSLFGSRVQSPIIPRPASATFAPRAPPGGVYYPHVRAGLASAYPDGAAAPDADPSYLDDGYGNVSGLVQQFSGLHVEAGPFDNAAAQAYHPQGSMSTSAAPLPLLPMSAAGMSAPYGYMPMSDFPGGGMPVGGMHAPVPAFMPGASMFAPGGATHVPPRTGSGGHGQAPPAIVPRPSAATFDMMSGPYTGDPSAPSSASHTPRHVLRPEGAVYAARREESMEPAHGHFPTAYAMSTGHHLQYAPPAYDPRYVTGPGVRGEAVSMYVMHPGMPYGYPPRAHFSPAPMPLGHQGPAGMHRPPVYPPGHRSNVWTTAPQAPAGDGGYGRRGGRREPAARQSNAVRSPLLEDFCAGRLRVTDSRMLAGHICEFACDPQGSRFVMHRHDVGDDAERQGHVTELLHTALPMMMDSNASSVIQHILERGSEASRLAIAQSMRDQVVNLSLHVYGCRVVQKALEFTPAETRVALARELQGHVMRCVQDQNANHVLQKVVEHVKGDAVGFLLDAFVGHAFRLSTHPFGCRIVQRVLQYCRDEQAAGVLAEVLRDADALLTHQYGNYVIQHILEHGRTEHRTIIVQRLFGQVVSLAQHKFASNVVERALECAAASEKSAIVEEILRPTLDALERDPARRLPDERSPNLTPLQRLLADQYGNYVMQKVLDVADDRQRALLCDILRSYAPTLRRYPYGKHILQRLEKMLSKMVLLPSAASGAADAAF